MHFGSLIKRGKCSFISSGIQANCQLTCFHHNYFFQLDFLPLPSMKRWAYLQCCEIEAHPYHQFIIKRTKRTNIRISFITQDWQTQGRPKTYPLCKPKKKDLFQQRKRWHWDEMDNWALGPLKTWVSFYSVTIESHLSAFFCRSVFCLLEEKTMIASSVNYFQQTLNIGAPIIMLSLETASSIEITSSLFSI